MSLYQVDANHYVAGLVVDRGRIVQAAPILRWTVGRDMQRVQAYLTKRGYRVDLVQEFAPGTMQ